MIYNDVLNVLFNTLPTVLTYSATGVLGICSLDLASDFIKPCIEKIQMKDEKPKDDTKTLSHKGMNSMKGDDGFVLSKNIRLSSLYSKQHVLVIGPTSSGKTSRIIKYNIERITNQSIICTDPSRDISRDIDKRKDGYKIYHLDFEHPSRSIGIDPIISCKNEFCVRSVMETIMINGFSEGDGLSSDAGKWIKITSALVNVYAVYNYRYRKYSFSEMINNLLTKRLNQKQVRPVRKRRPVGQDRNGAIIYRYSDEVGQEVFIDEDSIEYEILSTGDKDLIDEFRSFLNTIRSQEMIGSIYTTLNTVFGIFKDKDMKILCSKKPLDITTFRKEKSILYIHIPERYADYYKPISSVIIKQFLDSLQDNSKGLDVYFILDELCNIGIIPSFDKVLSTVRRYNIGILGCTQSINQLEVNYGEKGTSVILENFNTICALPGLKESSNYFSNLLGTIKVKEGEGQTRVEQAMSLDEIRTMGSDKLLIVSKNKKAVTDDMLPIYGLD